MIMPKEVRAAIRDAMREQGVDVPHLAELVREANANFLLYCLTGRQSIPTKLYVRVCKFLGLNPLIIWPTAKISLAHPLIVIAEQMEQRQMSVTALFDKVGGWPFKEDPNGLETFTNALNGDNDLISLITRLICSELDLDLAAFTDLRFSSSPNDLMESLSVFLPASALPAPAKVRKRKEPTP